LIDAILLLRFFEGNNVGKNFYEKEKKMAQMHISISGECSWSWVCCWRGFVDKFLLISQRDCVGRCDWSVFRRIVDGGLGP